MSSLILLSSICKDCGFCCFNCDYLDSKTGCTEENHKLNSRCSSFPLLFGEPKKMGYRNLKPISNQCFKEEQKWFILKLDECLLLQNEKIFNNLRWILAEVNSQSFPKWFFFEIENIQVEIYIL